MSFLVQDFVYSNESLGEQRLFFTVLSWKKTFSHMRRKYAYLNKNWSNTMKFPIIVFAGNPINKNRVLIVWKKYHNVIHFSIIVIFTSLCTLSITSLDIIILGYILSHSMGLELVHIVPFLVSVPILNPWKYQETKRLLGFSGGIKWEPWLNKINI